MWWCCGGCGLIGWLYHECFGVPLHLVLIIHIFSAINFALCAVCVYSALYGIVLNFNSGIFPAVHLGPTGLVCACYLFFSWPALLALQVS